MTMTRQELAAMIDHTNLKAYASSADMRKLCAEAVKYGFAMVAVNSGQSRLCSECLKGTGVHTGAAVGFPLGQQSIAAKTFETADAIANGADEIDYVINLTAVKDGDWDYVRREMEAVTAVCRQKEKIVKAIYETCYLTKEEIVKLAEIARVVKPDFIKTSTGFGTAGARLEDVKLMKETVGGAVQVKAAGGIRTLEQALAFVAAGAQRIGTSHGVEIIEAFL